MSSATEASRFTATYRILADNVAEAESRAKDIALEQTVEVPEDCVPPRILDARVVAELEGLEPAAAGAWNAHLSFRADIASEGAAGLLNVVYGNVSLMRGVRLVRLNLSTQLLSGFHGPRFGVSGLREMLGVPRRPLTATAVKPLGLSPPELAEIAGGYARGGVDVVKDDHGLIDQRHSPFEERVARCQEAVEAANASTGGCSIYVPMVAGRFERLEAQFAFAKSQGVRAVMTAPLLVGPDVARALAARYELALLAHPTFAGAALGDPSQGMTPPLLLGTLFRLFGADVSIFPNAGGRFAFTPQECVEIAEALRVSLGDVKPALPAPAGGMSLDRVDTMVRAFGRDVLLLIGGALMRMSRDPERGAAAFREAAERADAEVTA